MPNPTKINLPRINYRFIASACVPVLTVMLNKVEKDYSTVDELCDHDELSKFTRDEIKKAVTELCSRKFLLEVEKPYGCVYNCFEYVYSFFDVPVSKEEADEFEAETRHKAITIREGGRAKAAVSSMGEKQEVENPYLDNPPAETPLSENHGQYNTYNSIKRNSLLSDKSSIIPAAAKPTFNIPNVEKFAERVTDGYNAEEVKYFTEVVRENLDYWHLGDWLCQDGRDGYAEADEIVGFIVDEICSPLPYTTLRGQAFPRAVIQSKMLKANIYMVENVLENMAKVDNIKDFRRYFTEYLQNFFCSKNTK